jgi:hypothetical protein
MRTPQPDPALRAATPIPGTPLPASTVAAWELLASEVAHGLECDDPFTRSVVDDLEDRLEDRLALPSLDPNVPLAAGWPVSARRFARLHLRALEAARCGTSRASYVLAVEAVARLRTRTWTPADLPAPGPLPRDTNGSAGDRSDHPLPRRSPRSSSPTDASSTSAPLPSSSTRRSSAVGAGSAGSSSSSRSAA